MDVAVNEASGQRGLRSSPAPGFTAMRSGIAGQPVVNAMTIDVEDYFQVQALSQCFRRSDWPKIESRVERNTAKILSMLAEYECHATFFTLGWIAERHPRLLREIQALGHEIGSHG